MWIRLDEREHATVMAALRYWQREGLNSGGHEIEQIATNAGALEPMDAAEVNRLCERVIMSPQQASPKLLEVARENYAAPSDDDIEIDDDAATSEADEGTWVMAWCYVRREDFEDPDSGETEEEEAA